MTPLARAAYLAHARTEGFRAKLRNSRELVARWLEVSTQPYVSFSCGKDSSVCLALAREQAPETVAVYHDDEWLLPEMVDLLARTPNLRQVARTLYHADGFTCYPNGRPTELRAGVEWTEGSVSGDWVRREGFDGAGIGLRAEENARRRKHLRAFGALFFARNRQVWQCYPVAWWTVEDVWAYILSQEVPYCAAYDRLSDMEIPAKQQRIGPLVVERVAALGQVAILRRGWPDLYQRLTDQYPTLADYA